MADYLELDTLIRRLKRAAIDAWMRDEGWHIEDALYRRWDNVAGETQTVECPSDSGEGGGLWVAYPYPGTFTPAEESYVREDKYREIFAGLRDRIDGHLSPWTWLPDPARIEAAVEAFRQINSRLALEAGVVASLPVVPGPLSSDIEAAKANAVFLRGQLMDAFNRQFLNRIEGTVGGFWAVSLVCGGRVQAEWGIWDSARRDVVGIVEGATALMEVCGTPNPAVWKQSLHVLGWALKTAASFAPKVWDKVLEGAGLIIELAADSVEVTEAEEEVIELRSVDGVIDKIGELLDKLNQQIVKEERIVRDNLIANLRSISGNHSAFDLTPPPIRDNGSKIYVEPGVVDSITLTYLPGIANELRGIADQVRHCRVRSAIYRSAEIGIGSVGPGDELDELTGLLEDLTRSLSWEVEKGAENLRLAVKVMEEQETQFSDDLKAIARRVEVGSPYDPAWD